MKLIFFLEVKTVRSQNSFMSCDTGRYSIVYRIIVMVKTSQIRAFLPFWGGYCCHGNNNNSIRNGIFTELYVKGRWYIISIALNIRAGCGVMVRIADFQAVDPSSITARCRTFFLFITELDKFSTQFLTRIDTICQKFFLPILLFIHRIYNLSRQNHQIYARM